MSRDFLLELRSEEIPARMQDGARDSLARLFTAELAKAGLTASAITTYATPRRLALIARDLPAQTESVSEEVKGPRASAPPQALEGFLRKTGLTRDQLTERDGILFAVTAKPGRATADVLAEAIPAIVRAFPWPKSMRWGAASSSTESLRWVRPLHGIVALFGDDIVPVEIAGVTSGAATLGHRFHHPGPITIGSAHDYVEKLRACHVVVDQEERRTLIRDRAREIAAGAGLELIEDEGLVAENAGLTEWPVPLLGRFDPTFLDVPPEVIQLTARVNQKYFVCHDKAGSLANAFICTANIEATDGGARIIEGNRKVLAARLSDARFFYETDLKVPLDQQAAKLANIVFHEKLGTLADKVDRVAKLARWLVEEGIVRPSPLVGEGRGPLALASGKGEGDGATSTPPHPSAASPLQHRVNDAARHSGNAGGIADPMLSPTGGEGNLAALTERAARLCKADLVTGMVGEFPELQGIMGGYYAAAQGEDPQVAAAIRDHYKPVGQGDEVPTAPVTVAVSLADKLDTIVSFFGINEKPTGSKDPYALRRAALGIVRLVLEQSLRAPLGRLLPFSMLSLVYSLVDRDTYRAEFFVETGRGTPEHPIFSSLHDDEAIEAWKDDRGALNIWREEGHYAETEGVRSLELLPGSVQLPRATKLAYSISDFFADRLKVQQREAGVRHDLIDAVFAAKGPDGAGEDDLVRLLARTHALQSFITTEDGANLLTGYRRAANILKKEGWSPSPLVGEGRGPLAPASGKGEGDGVQPGTPPHPSAPAALQHRVNDAPRHSGHAGGMTDPMLSPTRGEGISLSYTPEKDEAALHAALDTAEPAAADAVAREDFEGAMAALATLRAPIDAFFDSVTVNDPDPAKRAARLALLARVRDAVHTVADFSRIVE